jgi:hypothetical protein
MEILFIFLLNLIVVNDLKKEIEFDYYNKMIIVYRVDKIENIRKVF